MKTQIFIRPETQNLVYNGKFKTIDGGWTEYEEDNCGHTMGLVADKLHYANPDGACGLTNVHEVYSTETVLEEGVEYKVTCNITYAYAFDPADPLFVKVGIGGNYTDQFIGTGIFTDTIIAGTGGSVSVQAAVDSLNGGIDISYLSIVENREVELDLYNDIDIPLTYTVADIREPEKRKSSFSKSFTVPSTPRNDKLFGHAFKISGDGMWNPNKKMDVYILQEGIQIFEGILQLTSIKNVDENKIEYEIDCSGKLANIFFEWGSLKLKDLDFTEYDHLFDKSTQKASWESYINKNIATYSNFTRGAGKTFSNTFFDAGYLGLQFTTSHGYSEGDWIRITKANSSINPQYNGWHRVLEVSSPTNVVLATSYATAPTASESGNAFSIAPTGEGYVYPIIDYGYTDNTFYKVENIYPAIYLKTYVDKAFELANFTYQSTFFDSKYFKHLIVPFNAESFKINGDQIAERLFKASKTTTETIRNPWESIYWAGNAEQISRVLYDDDVNNGNFDPNLVYNTSTGEWTVNRSGNYDIKANLTVACKAIADSFYNAYMGAEYTGASVDMVVELTLYRDPLVGSTIVLDSTSFTFVGGNQYMPGGIVTFPDHTMQVERLLYDFVLGDKIYVEVSYTLNTYGSNAYFNDGSPENYMCSGPCGNPFAVTGEMYFISKGGSFWNKVNNSTLPDGAVVELVNTVPDVTIKDLFTSILKMFNLYVETDKDDERKLIIETRNEFYSSTSIVDWTAKLDTSKVLEIRPMGELQAKEYSYTYKEDKDLLNADHQKVWGKIYGEKTLTIDNDFTTAKNENKLIFSPTVLQDRPANGDRIISSIRAEDATGPKPIASNIRLLYYSGVKYTSATYSYKSIPAGNTNEHYYSYAGHLDNPIHPVEDLNYTTPLGLYYDQVEWTDNNLFNKFHKQQIEEITDKNSKIVSGYFYLKPSDIYLLDFRKQFFVDGNYLRLNKIIDYNGNKNDVTKVEFIKTLNKAPFKPVRVTVKGGRGETVGTDKIATSIFKRGVNDNSAFKETISVTGYRNSVASTVVNANITGSDNRINSGSENIEIRNSNNINIGGGLRNVVVINSNNLTIDESDVMYINNIKIKNGAIEPKVDLVDGGENKKLSPFGTVTNILFVDGGEDETLGFGSVTPQNVIDGGEN